MGVLIRGNKGAVGLFFPEVSQALATRHVSPPVLNPRYKFSQSAQAWRERTEHSALKRLKVQSARDALDGLLLSLPAEKVLPSNCQTAKDAANFTLEPWSRCRFGNERNFGGSPIKSTLS